MPGLDDSTTFHTAIPALISLAIVVTVVVTIAHAAASPQARQFRTHSKQWCHAEGGTLGISNVIVPSGGLTCDFGGQSIDMSTVASSGWTHDWGRLHAAQVAAAHHHGWLWSAAGLLMVAVVIAIALMMPAYVLPASPLRGDPK